MSDDPTDDIDPFEEIDTEEMPDGDPFDGLEPDDSGPSEADAAIDDDTARVAGSEPTLDEEAFEGVSVTETERERPQRAKEEPFADLTEGVEDDPFEGGEWDASGTDESVWEELSTEPEIEVEEESGRRISEVNKHRFCEQCEYFTEPPEIACGHKGTEILAFTDVETVRVADCPIVEERERLERGAIQEEREGDPK